MKYHTALLVVSLLATTLVRGQTLTGYSHSASLPNYNENTIFPLFEEWLGLINPNLDVLPSARETELYQEIVRAERSASRVTSFDFDNKWADMYTWGSVSTLESSWRRIELAKDLAWLPTALDHADEMLALRDPVGTYSPNLGRNLLEPVWLSPHPEDNYVISPLNSGRNATYVARFANWILEHPELYPQTAPSNSVIPLAVPTTYYERAKFYITELKKTIDEEHHAGFFWEFDTGTQSGWVFQGDGALTGSDLAALYPGGISVSNILTVSESEGIKLHPYNRTLFFIAAHMETAKGLQLIDAYESTSVHTGFVSRAMDMNEKCMNYWRYHRVTHVEAGPNGTSTTWPYGANQDPLVKHEDATHFEMDVDPMTSLKDGGILSSNDLVGVTGSIYSRWFDPESHVYFQNLGRSLYTHEVTGLPESAYWWLAPGRSDWIGEAATHTQMQGYAMRSLEVFREQMRRAASDPVFKSTYLNRDDIRRSRNAKGPFEIYDLKMARNARGLTPTPGGNNPPAIDSVSPAASFSVPENTALGTVVGSVSASDPDAGQTVHYWISGGNIGNRFKIDPVTGVIRVNNYYALNDDDGAVTPLEITVMDDGVPMQLATTTVSISIEDTNSSPYFPVGQTGRFTRNLIKGDPVMTVNASDADGLKFWMESSSDLFTVDSGSGVVRIKDSATAASRGIGSTYTLKIGMIEQSALPLSKFETVEITCEASFGNASASVSSGTVPFSVDFNSTHTGGGSIVACNWNFGDSGTAGTPAASHTYTLANSYTVNALMMDDRGEYDRQTLAVTASGGGTVPPGLLAHYSFAEGSGTTAVDISGNGNDAALSGDAYDADGVAGTGFELRDHNVTVPATVHSVISSQISLCFFARGDADFHPYSSIFRASDAAGNKVLGSHLPWGGEGGTYFWDAGNSGSSYDRISSSAPIPAEDEWVHWVFTKDAGTGFMGIYTNGVLLTSGSGKTRSMSGIDSFKVGGNNYRGTIDELRIYNRALNSTEIADLYAAEVAGSLYTLSYGASENGTLAGPPLQTVGAGLDGSAVTAVADANYAFVDWSDGSTDNPRTDLNVAGSISVYAVFVSPDTDDDGLTDAQEQALGTDPNDPDSRFGIDGTPLPMSGKIEITWPSATGVLYRVWESPDLANWSVVRDWTNAAAVPEDTCELDLTPSNGFFKVEAQF